MNSIKQAFKIFSSKIIINVLIIILLCLFSITILEGIDLNDYYKEQLKKYSHFSGKDELLYISIPFNFSGPSIDDPILDFLSPESSFDYEIYRVGSKYFNVDNQEHQALFYSYQMLDFMDLIITEGRFPQESGTYLELLSLEGRQEIGDEFSIDFGGYTTAKIVGIYSKDSLIMRMDANSTSFYFTLVNSPAFYSFLEYSYVGIQSTLYEDSLRYDDNFLIEYDKDVYSANKIQILNELEENCVVSSLGKEYEVIENDIIKNIKQTILVTALLMLPILLFMFILYYNLFSIKSNIIGKYYLVGYSSKNILIILSIVTIIQLIFYVLCMTIMPLLGILRYGKESFFVLLIGATIILIGMGFNMLMFRFKSISKLINNNGE